jgi:broad specificity phosphatase PhoE
MTSSNAPSRSFLCVRHGLTDWNRQGLFQGRTDIALNDDGIAQAHAAARRLQGVAFDHVVSSPLARALRTAEIIAAAAAKPVSIDDGIIECDFGSLEGRNVRHTLEERGLSTPEDIVRMLPADGEAWSAVSARALACVGSWLERHPQADILFVCHDAVMQSMSQVLCGRWLNNRHAVPFRYTRTSDAWTIDEV